jgi:hypothetical protein
MSECILCKGKVSLDKLGENKIYYYPFGDFCNDCEEVCQFYWKGKNKDDIWTVEIDRYLTEAQTQICDGAGYEKTKIYGILKQLLEHDLEIIMWYNDFYEDIPAVYSEQDFFKEVFNGITDENGLCEVYVRYKHTKEKK